MQNVQREALEARLNGEHDDVVEAELASLSSVELLFLLDSKSRKIADVAASWMDRRNDMHLLIEALRNDQIRTAAGRICALNLLNWRGRALPQATDALIHCLDDASTEVVGSALFGIVFMRRRDLVPMLRQHLTTLESKSQRHPMFRLAINALNANDPMLFSPYFEDVNNVWRLHERC